MTEDLNDLMCPHSAAGRPERFPAKACIFAGECGCAYGAEWSRALRLADDAAESVICTEGHNTEGRQWVLYPEQIAADPYLGDAIAHLEWRGLAEVERSDDAIRLRLLAKDYAEARAIESASVANPAPRQPEAQAGGAVAWLKKGDPYAVLAKNPANAPIMLAAGYRPLIYGDTTPPAKVPEGMIERIKAAEQRILDGHAPRRIPADPTDVDLVLAEVRLFLEGKPAPFWLAAAPAPKEDA